MTEHVTDAAQVAPEGVSTPKTDVTAAKVVDYTAEDNDTATETHAEGSAENADGEGKERDPWPRTAQDAVRRRNKRLAKRDAEISDLRKQMQERDAEIAKYKPKEATVDPNDPEPALSQYNDWGKYNSDLTKWNMRQIQKSEQANKQPAAQQPGMQFSPQEQQWMQQRVSQVAQRRNEVIKDNPEYAEVLKHSGEAIDDLPEAIQLELLKCKDPVLSVIAAAQEGFLDDLADMSPSLAAKYLNEAAARLQGKTASPSGQAETQQTQAPAPISRPRAQSKSQKSPLEMSDDEFRKKYLTRR